MEKLIRDKRYKTADTRISLSRKLPPDFFHKKDNRGQTYHTMKNKSGYLPTLTSVIKSQSKNNQAEEDTLLFTFQSPKPLVREIPKFPYLQLMSQPKQELKKKSNIFYDARFEL
jgi:hypothetical protein